MTKKKFTLALATVVFATATMFPVQAQAIEVQPLNTNKVSGSHSCPAGQRVGIRFSSNSSYSTLVVNGKVKGTSSFVYHYDTGLQSATWNVTGYDIDYAYDHCLKGPFADGGGGNF